MSLFAVLGVSGHTGRVVAESLLSRGHRVRVVVRDEAKAAPFVARGAELALADVTDAAALGRALEGVDGAYLLVPPNFATGDMRGWQARVSDALVAAVTAAAPPHVVLLSSVGAQHPDGTGPIQALFPLEARLRALPASRSSFLRAAYFMENLLGNFGMLDQGLLPSFTPAGLGLPMIATVDIGEAAADLLLEGPPAEGARVVELGSEPVSTQDVADALAAQLGRPVQVAEAPAAAMAETLRGFGFPADVAALYQEMTEGAIGGRVAFEGGHRRLHGRVGVAAFLASALPAGASA